MEVHDMALHLGNITLDCANALELGAFWSGALERPIDPDASEFFASIGRGSGQSPTWMFIQVPEGKTAKNRMHIDLMSDDPATEVQRLIALGAVHIDDKDEWGIAWSVLQDPSGNEFCVSGVH
jgi:Glyoxalase-like domain